MMRFLKIYLILFSILSSQERDSVKIYINSNPEGKTVNILTNDSLKYFSFEGIANGLGANYSFNEILKKGSFWIGSKRFQFVAESEFYAMFDTTKKRFSLIHLPNKIQYIDSGLFIESNYFIDQILKSSNLIISFSEPKIKVINKIKSEDEKSKIEIGKKRLAEIKKLNSDRKKWMLDVIVIDPGHGGKDPGSIGTNGILEKDITIGVAAKLGRLIKNKLPEVEVLFTRTSDSFVELYKRGKFANDAKGKLFISIHCNSHEVKPSNPKGFEIYLLRPGKTNAAIRVAEKENSVIDLEENSKSKYQKITEENFILLTLAQSSYLKQSETFAEILEKEMSKKLETDSRGVKQAGFYVLVGASMPNVLIETGYLSNLKEEEFLASQDGQQNIAKSIFEAIRLYKVNYENQIVD